MTHAFSELDIQSFDKTYRLHLINSLSGYKSVFLIGTYNQQKVANLALVSSLTHIGSDPAQISFVMRPTTARRDTYNNLKKTPFFTVNLVQENFLKQAHYASAKFPEEVSEFEQLGLEEINESGFNAPFVGPSHLKFGCELIEEKALNNGTILLVGQIKHLFIHENMLEEDGKISFSSVGAVAVSGLNTYHRVQKLMELPYARVSELPNFKNPNTKQRPDNVVFDEQENRYSAALKKYTTNVGAPAIVQQDMNNWKNVGTNKVNHHLKTKFESIKKEYESVLELYQWNEMIYQSKFEFEPITGQTYHLYEKEDGSRFLSQIGPTEWNRKHLGSFQLNSDRIFQKI